MTAGERDALHLGLIGEAIADLQRRLADADYTSFLSDRDEQALTAFRLSIIGENANKLSADLKGRNPRLPWADMIAFRHIVSHEYHRVDPTLVWEAAYQLDEIAEMVDAELARLGLGNN